MFYVERKKGFSWHKEHGEYKTYDDAVTKGIEYFKHGIHKDNITRRVVEGDNYSQAVKNADKNEPSGWLNKRLW
jgi:hypothetical protein